MSPIPMTSSFFVHPVGLEPTTYDLENRCSIQLSYGCVKNSFVVDFALTVFNYSKTKNERVLIVVPHLTPSQVRHVTHAMQHVGRKCVGLMHATHRKHVT